MAGVAQGQQRDGEDEACASKVQKGDEHKG